MKNKLSFKTYLVLSLILVSIIPIIAVGTLSLKYMTEKTTQNIETDNQLLANAVGWEIRGHFQQAKAVVEQLAIFLSGHDHDDDQISGLLTDTVDQFEYFESIYLLNSNGHIEKVGLPYNRISMAEEYIGLDMSHTDYYRQVNEFHKPTWSNAYLSHITGKLSLTLTVPVNDEILVTYFSIEHLADRIQQIQTGGNLIAMLVDTDGILIFHPDDTKSKEKISLRNLTPVQAGLAGNEGTYKYKWQQVEYIGSVAMIPDTGWLLIVSQTTKNAYASIRQMQKIFTAGIGIAAVIALLLAIALSTRLIEPLRELQASTRTIASGNYETQINSGPYFETEELASSFENMAEAVRMREQEREKLLKTLGEQNEELESIIYASSHDLRSPLVNIHGFSGELEEDCRIMIDMLKDVHIEPEYESQLKTILNEDIPSAIGFIKTSTSKLDALQRGLLKLCRLGREDVNISALNMNKLMDEVIDSMQHQVNQLNANVVVDELPGCYGDRDKINQVFSNLVDNALKYRNPDIKPEIKITGCIKDDRSVYKIADNGIGINPDYHTKVFDVFHQLNPDHKIGGEGLGLTIVKRILDKLEGSINIESEQKKGSVFSVSLPAVSNRTKICS